MKKLYMYTMSESMVAFTVATSSSLSMCLKMCCVLMELFAKPCTAIADDCVPTLPPIPASSGMNRAISGCEPNVLVKQLSSMDEPIPPNIPMMSHSGTPSFPNELLTALDTSNTRFFDNYLEMAIDTCHIPYIFTANDISPIPQPLLDRMEVVQLDAPTRDTLVTIARGHTLPNLLRIYDSQGIQIEENTIETLVDALWRNGNRSCRPYERALKQLISDAYLQQVETGQTVVISAYDARHTAKQFCAAEDSGRPIGFLTA